MDPSTTENTPEENGSSEITLDAPGRHTVGPRDPGSYYQDPERGRIEIRSPGVGHFEIRDPDPTTVSGWDVAGTWDLSAEEGIVILSIGLVQSRFVKDGVPPGKVRLRAPGEHPRSARSQDLSRIRLDEVRSVIRHETTNLLKDPFFRLPKDSPPTDPARRLVEGLEATAASKETRGRRPTTDGKLDQWARDVIEALEDDATPLYWALEEKWGVSYHTVKNHRLPRLKTTGRLEGRGRGIVEGPNFPREKEN